MPDYQSDAERYAQTRNLHRLYGKDISGNEGSMSALAVVEKKTVNAFTPAHSDNGKILLLSDATAVAVTLRNDLPIGYAVRGVQYGAGAVTFSAQAGGTLRGTAATTAQYSGLTAVVIDQGADGKSAEWLVG